MTNNLLSEREVEILKLVAEGLSNKEVASRLFISVNTVKVHLANIFQKIGKTSRTEATLYAIKEGIVASPLISQVFAQPNLNAPTDAVPLQSDSRQFKSLLLLFAVAAALILSVFVIGSGLGWFTNTDENTQVFIQSRWQKMPELPEGRKNMAVLTHQNQLLVLAGETNDGIVPSVLAFDTRSLMWKEVAPKPTAVSYVSAAMIGEKIYVPGGKMIDGKDTDLLEVLNPRSWAWESKQRMPYAINGYALATVEGELFLFGGMINGQPTDIVLSYDPNNDSWEELNTKLANPLAYASATTREGVIYLVGGWDGKEWRDQVLSFSPARNITGENPWEEITRTPARFKMPSAYIEANSLYITGQESLWQYPLTSNVWNIYTYEPSLLPEDGKMVSQDGYIYLIGGSTQDGGKPANFFARFQAIFTIAIPYLPK